MSKKYIKAIIFILVFGTILGIDIYNNFGQKPKPNPIVSSSPSPSAIPSNNEKSSSVFKKSINYSYDKLNKNQYLEVGIANTIEEFTSLLEQNQIEENNSNELDFYNYQYALIITAQSYCGGDINYVDHLIINNEAIINFEEKVSCGPCAPEFIFYEIGLPKTENIDTIKANYTIPNHPDCDPTIEYKPVLYLYPEEKTNITVNFAHEDYLLTTYPKYNQEWQVTAHPNGDLYDKENNYYYALYWEENNYEKYSFKEGFYVTKDNAISFLEEKLTLLGLNSRERNEFIMYWLPILEQNEKSIVSFELTEDLQNNNALIINPKPDSLLRIRMYIKKVNNYTNIKEQSLPTNFQRNGFTAIEWGGIIVD